MNQAIKLTLKGLAILTFQPHALVSPKPEREEDWLAWRNKGVGGSDASTLMGHNAYKSTWELWQEKRTALTGRPTGYSAAGEAAHWGNVMEPVLAAEFTARTGLSTAPAGLILQSRNWPWMLATPDYLVDEGGTPGLLELKTRSAQQLKEWRQGVPESVDDQCQQYLQVTGLDHMWIACLIGGNHFEYYRVARNEQKLQLLTATVANFWGSVLEGKDPGPAGEDSDTEALSVAYPQSIESTAVTLTPDVWRDVNYLARIKRYSRGLERKAAQAENRVKAALRDAGEGTWQDRAVVSWTSVRSLRVDVTRLREEQPELVKRYEVPATARTFRILLKPEEILDIHEEELMAGN